MDRVQTDRLSSRMQTDVAHFDSEMTELRLLLPERQLRALELAACCHGLSVGEMLRRMLGEFLHEPA